jgi:hypothetical protein
VVAEVQTTHHSEVERSERGRGVNCTATTRSGRPCPTPALTGEAFCVMHSRSPKTQALMAEARRLGGAAPRARLGLNTDLAALTLGSAEDQLSLLVATARALAQGSISASTAGALTNIVKAAQTITAQDQAEQIDALAQRLEALTVRR